MKELRIEKNDAGMRLDRYLAKAVPLLPASLAQKYIRIKRIKRNGARVQRDDRLAEGDCLQLYINDEFFDRPRADNAYLTVTSPRLHIVYEDENILLVDKQPGLAVHPMTAQNMARPSLTISRLTFMPREHGGPGSPPLSRPCATGSTGIPAALSSPPKMPKPCGFSTKR